MYSSRSSEVHWKLPKSDGWGPRHSPCDDWQDCKPGIDGWSSVGQKIYNFKTGVEAMPNFGREKYDFKASAEAMPKFGTQTIPPNDLRGSYAQFPVNGNKEWDDTEGGFDDVGNMDAMSVPDNIPVDSDEESAAFA